jgi:cytochrome b6-f complex iron-sulfur subunit
MSNQMELHDCSAACPLAHATPETAAGGGMSRRTFLTQGALAAIAVALAACGGDSPVAPSIDSNTIHLADHPALGSVGGVAFVTLVKVPLAVVRTGDSSFVALARPCPHQGPLVNTSSSGFTCPRHGARFSITGEWVGGPAETVKTFEGLQQRNLRSYPVQYEPGTGTLTIEI